MRFRKVLRVVTFSATLCVTIYVIGSVFESHEDTGKRCGWRYSINETAANMLHRGGSDRAVFYNRVGKCGSRSLMEVVRYLAGQNNFREISSHNFDGEVSIHPKDLYSEIAVLAGYIPPVFYNRHVYFLDFKSVGVTPPYYINMIRDPIDRFSSHYNYLKYGDVIGEVDGGSHSLKDINTCVSDEVNPCNSDLMTYIRDYFCGHNCNAKYRTESVTVAKKHIDDYYVLVGLIEEFEATLLLLEVFLPSYFKGARDAWEKVRKKEAYSTIRKDELTDEAKYKLRYKLLKDEYDVYNHVKERFDQLKKKYLIEVS